VREIPTIDWSRLGRQVTRLARRAEQDGTALARRAEKDGTALARRAEKRAVTMAHRAEQKVARRLARTPQPAARRSALSMARFPLLAGLGWFIGWLTDPTSGAGRRRRLADRSRAVARRGTRRARSKSAYVRGRAQGKVARMRGAGEPHPVDDVEVKQQVRQALARSGFTRGDVLIDVCNGSVTLRGELSDEGEIARAETVAAEAPGVLELVSDLHVPGQAMPHHKVVALHAS